MFSLTTFSLVALAMLMSFSAAMASDYKVFVKDESRIFPGFTLFTDVSQKNRQRIIEVNSKGEVVWSYEPRFGPRGTLLDAVYLDSNRIMYTVSGHGIFEVDRKGQILWRHLDSEASHDSDRLPNGNTLYNRAWVAKGEDVVREISPQGAIVWRWNGLKEFNKPPFDKVKDEGWMHVNAVSRLASGNTLISIRNFNQIVEVNFAGEVVKRFSFAGEDRRTLTTEGRIRGVRNHEPEVLASGNILMAIRKPDRYIEIEPDSERIVWQWRVPEGHDSSFNRDANRLPNGNTLVTTGSSIYEVSETGEIVWHLKGPNQRSDGDKRVFHKVVRITQDGQIFGD